MQQKIEYSIIGVTYLPRLSNYRHRYLEANRLLMLLAHGLSEHNT